MRIVRSGRKTVAIEITGEAEIVVRAPYRMSDAKIKELLDQKKGWIEKHLNAVKKKKEESNGARQYSAEELTKLFEMAKRVIPQRVEYYASRIGVTYGRITIRNQKTRWGSCSSKGNLNFNCRLMAFPEHVIDYVVVHELCHRIEMNHSARFWAQVEKYIPDYMEVRRYLRNHEID